MTTRKVTASTEWITLEELRRGALFETESGTLAVKSEYRYNNTNPQPMCILLGSGEFAHFPEKQLTKVREVVIFRGTEELRSYIKQRRQAIEDSASYKDPWAELGILDEVEAFLPGKGE